MSSRAYAKLRDPPEVSTDHEARDRRDRRRRLDRATPRAQKVARLDLDKRQRLAFCVQRDVARRVVGWGSLQPLAAVVEISPAFIVQADAMHNVVVNPRRGRNRELLDNLARKPRVIGLSYQIVPRGLRLLSARHRLPGRNKTSTD